MKNAPTPAMILVVAALAQTNAQPYMRNRVRGMAHKLPQNQCTAVMTRPAPSEGERHKTNFSKGVPERRRSRSDDCRTIKVLPTIAPINAAINQIPNQNLCKLGAKHKAVAMRPMAPSTMPAEPGTASSTAPSMEDRM